jgi:hypothetical protein
LALLEARQKSCGPGRLAALVSIARGNGDVAAALGHARDCSLSTLARSCATRSRIWETRPDLADPRALSRCSNCICTGVSLICVISNISIRISTINLT